MKNSSWYLYIIRTKFGTLYTGITTDVDKRFKTHLDGKGAKFLRGKAPLTLEFSVEAGNKSSASKLEIRIKKLTKAKKEKLILDKPLDLLIYLGYNK